MGSAFGCLVGKASTVDGLLPRPMEAYRPIPIPPSSRAIVIGMGGGCDCFAAAAIAKLLQAESSGATVLFANCIGPRPLPQDHTVITPSLFRVPEKAVALEPGDEAYGSTRLECSISRGPEGSPYLIQVPKDGKSGLSIEEVTRANAAAIGGALSVLKVDQVVAVDLGGDSLTGGADFDGGSFEFGRDRQVLHALSTSGIPFIHIVCGPGCDGESTIDMMKSAVAKADESGALLGVLQLDDLIPHMAEMAQTLSSSRTPNILSRALATVEARRRGVPDAEGECYAIERHGNQNLVPWSWLTVGLVFK